MRTAWALSLAAAACGRAENGRDGQPAGGAQGARAEPPTAENGPAPGPRALARGAGPADAPSIVFLGTSLTAGYGLASPDLAYPALVGRRLETLGYRYRVVNAGVSGDTSAGGRTRLGGLLASYGKSLALMVVELGANDGLRGRDTEALYENLVWIASETRRHAPGADVVIASMEAPPNMGAQYADRFRATFGRAAEDAGTALAPFLLEGVAAEPELNQGDRIHPNAAGHEVLAENVWPTLEAVLASRCRGDGAC